MHEFNYKTFVLIVRISFLTLHPPRILDVLRIHAKQGGKERERSL
jgi:hypothetical protein